MVKENRQEKIERVAKARQEGVIVLENVHDPHNIGAVCRTAEGLGFQKIWLVFETEKRFNPKRVGKASSSSANKWLDFRIFETTGEMLTALKDEGYEIWATTIGKKAQSLWRVNFKNKKIALMLGNEHRGLSQKAIKAAEGRVTIPMKGMVQSFNISVTAAIILAEISRQREKKKGWELDESENKEIKERWKLFNLYKKKQG